MDISLTDAERLILANQYRILSYLDRNEGESWSQLSDQLRDGHAWLYDSYLKMSMSPVLSEDDARFVIRVLALYSEMRDSYLALNDKGGISDHDVLYPGFDGNDSYEAVLLRFTEALRTEGKFQNTLTKDRDLNSHFTSVRGYRRMIAAWEQMGEPRYPLAKSQIEELVLMKRT
jgi:uncharacterized protein YfbU (UPF0304 family)